MLNPKTAAILNPDTLPSKDRGGGIRTVPLVTARVGSTSMLNGVTTLEPGAAVPLHFHNCEESVLVLSGGGRVQYRRRGDRCQSRTHDVDTRRGASFLPQYVLDRAYVHVLDLCLHRCEPNDRRHGCHDTH